MLRRVRFDLRLAAGESKDIDLVCPVLPGRRAARHQWDNNPWFKIDQAQFDPPEGGLLQPDPGLDFYQQLAVSPLFEQARAAWKDVLGPPRLQVPDPRWEPSRMAVMSHLAMALNEGAPDLAVVNLSVFNRDAAYMANALEKSRLPGLAEIYLDHFLRYPFQGRVEPEADNPGQVLWSLGEHWKYTGDRAWLKRVYPAVERLVALIRYVRTTPGPHWVYDDTLEFGDALPKDRRKELEARRVRRPQPVVHRGVRHRRSAPAVVLAQAVDKKAEAAAWQTLADAFWEKYDQAYGADLGKGYGSYAVQWPCRLYPLGEGKAHARFQNIGARKTGEWRYFPLATAHQGLLSGNRRAGHGTIASHLAEPQMRDWYAFDEGGPSGVGGWPKLLSNWSWNYPPEPRPAWARTSARAMPDGWVLAEPLALDARLSGHGGRRSSRAAGRRFAGLVPARDGRDGVAHLVRALQSAIPARWSQGRARARRHGRAARGLCAATAPEQGRDGPCGWAGLSACGRPGLPASIGNKDRCHYLHPIRRTTMTRVVRV